MPDGNIVHAKIKLSRAIQRLTEPRPGVYHDCTLYAPSLYSCLKSDLAGTQGDTRTPAKSLPPIWLDASMLLTDIDIQAVKWFPSAMDTTDRLQRLTVKAWRPQDTDHVRDITRTVNSWCESIINLLDPESQKFISAPCPSCGKGIVYRRDSAGDEVRQPALKLVVSQGCTCQACGAYWAPEKFMFLGRLLGYEMPEGVLE
jgi:predicted RNA-binding Zn-ribbon protein involved in translation (DUF1610 family)